MIMMSKYLFNNVTRFQHVVYVTAIFIWVYWCDSDMHAFSRFVCCQHPYIDATNDAVLLMRNRSFNTFIILILVMIWVRLYYACIFTFFGCQHPCIDASDVKYSIYLLINPVFQLFFITFVFLSHIDWLIHLLWLGLMLHQLHRLLYVPVVMQINASEPDFVF